MNNSFIKTFGIIAIISLILLVLGEWLINKNIEITHVIGWLFVATFIGALVGIIKQNHTH